MAAPQIALSDFVVAFSGNRHRGDEERFEYEEDG